MRCPSCEKFVSYDTEVEPEESGEPQVDGDTVTAEYRRVLTCGECSEELKESNIEVQCEIELEKAAGCKSNDPPESCDFEVETCEVEATEDIGSRYKATLYGCHVTGTVKCQKCGVEGKFEGDNSERASSFDELV